MRFIQIERTKFSLVDYVTIFFFLSLFFDGFYVFKNYLSFALKSPFFFAAVSVVIVLFQGRFLKLNLRLVEVFFLTIFSISAFLTYAVDIFTYESMRYFFAAVLFLSIGNILRNMIEISLPSLHDLFFYAVILIPIVSLAYYLIGIIDININPISANFEYRYGALIDRQNIRLVGLMGDPNISGLSMMLLSVFSIFFIPKKSLNNVLRYLPLLALILTYSRASILTFIIVSFFILSNKYPRIYQGKIKSFLKDPYISLAGISLSFLSFLCLVYFFALGSISFDFSPGERVFLWKYGLELLSDNLFVGVGLNNYVNKFDDFYGGNSFIHNSHLQILVEAGLPIFILYVVLWWLFFKLSMKFTKDCENYPAYLLLGLFINLSSLSYLVSIFSISIILLLSNSIYKNNG